MDVLAVIPARGGSKSVPRKNLQLLHGIPLVAYSIEVALRSGFISHVIVSTDDDEISEVSKSYGADVVKRPSSISGDFSRDHELFEHLTKIRNLPSETLITFLRPTHPIRNPQTLQKAFDLFVSRMNEYDSLRSLKKSSEIIFKKWGIMPNGEAIPAYNPQLTNVEDPCNAPRQLLPDTYYQDGYVEVFPLATINKYKNTSGRRILPFIVAEYSQDIDTVEELASVNQFLTAEDLPVWFRYPQKK